MSKRAEELALKIARIGQMRCDDPECELCAENKSEAAALIDAELRKERESCADLAVAWCKNEQGGDDDDPDWQEYARCVRAAILADEED